MMYVYLKSLKWTYLLRESFNDDLAEFSIMSTTRQATSVCLVKSSGIISYKRNSFPFLARVGGHASVALIWPALPCIRIDRVDTSLST